MEQAKLDLILKQHDLWLEADGEHGTRADLTGANLTGANLRWADLTGANLDFSSLPLWCGSFGMIVSPELIYQLAYHICWLTCDNPDAVQIKQFLAQYADKSHLVTIHNCPLIGDHE